MDLLVASKYINIGEEGMGHNMEFPNLQLTSQNQIESTIHLNTLKIKVES